MVEGGYFISNDNKLWYCMAMPTGQMRRCGIIFVHAADGNRLGPHRMFVELARKYNELGYPTLRFDLAGCGDSTGSVSSEGIRGEVLDVVNAVGFFRDRMKLDGVILFGISRGARVSYTAMVEHKLAIDGLILLSTPLSSGQAALKSFGGQLKEYAFKLGNGKSVRKLISGKADVVQIFRTLLKALRLNRRYQPVEDNGFATKAPVLLIYGEHDPICREAGRYYSKILGKNDVRHECHVVSKANHSFFHYRWKQEIFDISKRWLEKIHGEQ